MMTKDDLKKVLDDHALWLRGEGGARANLRWAYLEGANLRWADLRWAYLEGANLRGANLRGASLWGADLRGVNLQGADLRGVNLQDTNLRWADLQDADLRWADLRGADLQDADLQDANLWSTVGNGGEIKSLQCGVYDIAFTHNVLQIVCKRYPIKEWFEFDDGTISSMDGGALEWWRKWKPLLKQIVEVA